MCWIWPWAEKNDDGIQPFLTTVSMRQERSVLIAAAAVIIFLNGTPGMSQVADPDVRPFAEKLSDYRQYPIDAPVQAGDWIYKINRAAPILADKHLRHSNSAIR